MRGGNPVGFPPLSFFTDFRGTGAPARLSSPLGQKFSFAKTQRRDKKFEGAILFFADWVALGGALPRLQSWLRNSSCGLLCRDSLWRGLEEGGEGEAGGVVGGGVVG